MTEILIFFFFIIFSSIIYFISVKKKLILDNTSFSKHKTFSSNLKTIPLLGGFFLLISIILFLNLNLNFVIIFFLIFCLGLFSDINFLFKPTTRFYLQALILFSFFFFSDIQILSTRIGFLDKLLEYSVFNYFFCCFCLMILINGYNFIDGLNGLSLGYFILVVINLFLINEFILPNSIFINNIYFIFSIFLIFVTILLSKIFLGDSGSYLIGVVTGLQIISVNFYNPQISPYFLILLIWYPCFEVLFSMIRKKINKTSPLIPDTKHLHQLIYIYFKENFLLKYSNSISSIIILLYNLFIIFFIENLIYNSLICILILCLNVMVYLIVYFLLSRSLYDFKKTK